MHDRFDLPADIICVTASNEDGGEYLICGTERVALYDTGMAYSAKQLVSNTERALARLGRETLDAILISHSHYDHVGALGYVLRRWPQATVYGAAKAKSVFENKSAVNFMKKMSENACSLCGDSNVALYMDGMRIDVVARDGDRIDLGDKYIEVLETKGHTDCSLTYIVKPDNIMFSSESTGVYVNIGNNNPAILKSYAQTKASLQKCRQARSAAIISPHYNGLVPANQVDCYFDVAEMYADKVKDLICSLIQRGETDEEIYEAYEAFFWPLHGGMIKKAFTVNAKACIKSMRREFFSV